VRHTGKVQDHPDPAGLRGQQHYLALRIDAGQAEKPIKSTSVSEVVDDLRQIVPKIIRGVCHGCAVHVMSLLRLTMRLAALGTCAIGRKQHSNLARLHSRTGVGCHIRHQRIDCHRREAHRIGVLMLIAIQNRQDI
jgi:hypothetical protein